MTRTASEGKSEKSYRSLSWGVRLCKEVKARKRRSGRKMSHAIFVAFKAKGNLTIGDKKQIDRAVWRKPRGIRLTPTSRYVRDTLFPS
jgi:8-oxo-dGTP diphosphatase